MAGAGNQQTVQPNLTQATAGALYGAGAGTAQAMGFQPGQLATTNLQAYQNPYTKQVIEASQADILRGAKMGMQDLARQAQQAKAFGGSRHGVAMSELGRGVAEQLGQVSAQQRQAGFQTAQQMAQQDIANRLAAQQFNVQTGLQGAQQRLGAAQQLANIANLGFGMGQTVTQNLAQQGAQQRAMQQQLMDLAAQRYGQYTQAPVQSLGYVSSALGATPVPQTQVTSRQPGLFDYLTMAATAAGGTNWR